MNNAGLPGTGLGGLFYVLLALWMPIAELGATLQGRSSVERWRQVGSQFAQACAIVASVAATVVVYRRVVRVPTALGLHGRSLLLAPLLLAVVLLSALVVTIRLWARFQTPRTPPEGEPYAAGGVCRPTAAPRHRA